MDALLKHPFSGTKEAARKHNDRCCAIASFDILSGRKIHKLQKNIQKTETFVQRGDVPFLQLDAEPVCSSGLWRHRW